MLNLISSNFYDWSCIDINQVLAKKEEEIKNLKTSVSSLSGNYDVFQIYIDLFYQTVDIEKLKEERDREIDSLQAAIKEKDIGKELLLFYIYYC